MMHACAVLEWIDSAKETTLTVHQPEGADAAFYRAALDALPEPVLIYDDDCVLYANEAAHRALGASDSLCLQGMRVADFILPDLAEVNNARRSYVLDHGVELRNLMVKIRGLDGEPSILHIDVKPIRFGGTTAAMATLARRQQ